MTLESQFCVYNIVHICCCCFAHCVYKKKLSISCGTKANTELCQILFKAQKRKNPFKMGHSQPLCLYFCRFNSKQCKCRLYRFDDGWIRTKGLWYWRPPLCQPSHNRCPEKTFCYYLRKTRLTKLSESILTFINFIFPLSGLQIGLVN